MKIFIASHQLNIMLALGSICGITAVFSMISKGLSAYRRFTMVGMELSAMILLFSDRLAYIYRGQMTRYGFFMTRVSNFMVYSMTITVILFVNMYLTDLCVNEGKAKTIPKALIFNDLCAAVGLILIIISQYTNFYYYFDESNHYVRAPGFIICYVIPVFMGLVQLYVIMQYYDRFNKRVALPLIAFTLAPLIAGAIQVFTYGLSLTNITMVGIIIIIYVFTLVDMNDSLDRAHKIEMDTLLKEKMSMMRLFKQTSTAFVASIEKKDPFLHGHSERVADIARRLAALSGMDDEDCDKVYYTALLHDIGMIGLPDKLIGKTDNLTEEEFEMVKQKPLISSEILSGITEYPYLSQGAKYCYERYDGQGYPEGLSGNAIPKISRIISVANAYDAMTTKKRFRDALPIQIVREELIKGAGGQFDPELADIMVHLIDSQSKEFMEGVATTIEDNIQCRKYRETVTIGYPIVNTINKIRFKCDTSTEPGVFSAPSIIVFDSYDRHVHENVKAIEANRYLEYGEIWFDGHFISTGARNIEILKSDGESHYKNKTEHISKGKYFEYEIVMGRYEDHLKLVLKGPDNSVTVVLALPNKSKFSYIGLTGENCHIYDISVEQTEDKVAEGDIPRIAEEISYIDRIESDVPNVQVDRLRSASTEGIDITDGTQIKFHSMSLPTANLVWDCPYIVLFYSNDKKVGGRGYREYALIKLNGENENSEEYAENKFFMRKEEKFSGWDRWKNINKEGHEYEIEFEKKGNRVTVRSNNLGIYIENTTRIRDGSKTVYAAITGNQVALTDIRIL